MVFHAWRQLYLFRSKPSMLPLQTGSGRSSREEFGGEVGKSSVSDAGPGNVLFAGVPSVWTAEKPWVDASVSARVKELRSRKRQLMYNINEDIVLPTQHSSS